MRLYRVSGCMILECVLIRVGVYMCDCECMSVCMQLYMSERERENGTDQLCLCDVVACACERVCVRACVRDRESVTMRASICVWVIFFHL